MKIIALLCPVLPAFVLLAFLAFCSKNQPPGPTDRKRNPSPEIGRREFDCSFRELHVYFREETDSRSLALDTASVAGVLRGNITLLDRGLDGEVSANYAQGENTLRRLNRITVDSFDREFVQAHDLLVQELCAAERNFRDTILSQKNRDKEYQTYFELRRQLAGLMLKKLGQKTGPSEYPSQKGLGYAGRPLQKTTPNMETPSPTPAKTKRVTVEFPPDFRSPSLTLEPTPPGGGILERGVLRCILELPPGNYRLLLNGGERCASFSTEQRFVNHQNFSQPCKK